MSKKRICFIAQFPPPIHGLSKAVDTLFSSEMKNQFQFEKVNITDNKKFLKNLWLIIRSKADLFYFTISQTKGGNLRDLLIFKLIQLKRKKCLIHLHGGYYRKLVDNDLPSWQKRANYTTIAKLNGAIVLGDSLKFIFQGMIDEDKIYVVPNCVDDKYLMSDSEFEKKVATIEKRRVRHVLYLSNFIVSKGFQEVLEMAKLEKERCKVGGDMKLHFDFAGQFFQKTVEDFFFGYIKENGLENYVTYHGVVGGNKKRELLRNCDVFVLLTRYPNEGQPISILEAMGNGMVIITTNHAGIPDIVKDRVNGILVDKENFSAKQCLKDIIANKNEDIKLIVRWNREICKKTYNQSLYIEEIGRLFYLT